MDSVFLNFMNTLELFQHIFSSTLLTSAFMTIHISVTIPWASFFPFDMLSLFTL